jgi:hypothetical protein
MNAGILYWYKSNGYKVFYTYSSKYKELGNHWKEWNAHKDYSEKAHYRWVNEEDWSDEITGND